MATYNELTQEQKDILQSFTNFVRGWCGEQARANNHGEAANNNYNAQVITILSLLNVEEIIPNTSGLSGAASLTKEEIITLVSHVQNMQADMSTYTSGFNTSMIRQAWTKAAGVGNMIG